jgi:hypothetical protein
MDRERPFEVEARSTIDRQRPFEGRARSTIDRPRPIERHVRSMHDCQHPFEGHACSMIRFVPSGALRGSALEQNAGAMHGRRDVSFGPRRTCNEARQGPHR